MADNYILWANRLKSGCGDGILIESDQITDNNWTAPELSSHMSDLLDAELQEQSKNTNTSSIVLKQRQDWINYELTSHIDNIYNSNGVILSSMVAINDNYKGLQATLSGHVGSQSHISQNERDKWNSNSDNITALGSRIDDIESNIEDTTAAANNAANNAAAAAKSASGAKTAASNAESAANEAKTAVSNVSTDLFNLSSQSIHNDLLLASNMLRVELSTIDPNLDTSATKKIKKNTILNLDVLLTTAIIDLPSVEELLDLELTSNLKLDSSVIESTDIASYYFSSREFEFVQCGLYFLTSADVSDVSLKLSSNILWANDRPLVLKPNSLYESLFTTVDNGVNYTATWTTYDLGTTYTKPSY